MEKKVEEMTEEAIEKMKKQHEFFGFRTEKTMERAEQLEDAMGQADKDVSGCLLYTSPSPRDGLLSRMPSSA